MIYHFQIAPLPLLGTEVLKEASREELLVLLAMREADGRADGHALSLLLSVSEAKIAGAVAYWQAAGVLVPEEGRAATVETEHASSVHMGKTDEMSPAHVAAAIRDHGLADLMSECATLLGKPALSGKDAQNIAALYTQYCFSEEYIVTLLSHLAHSGRSTTRRLVNEAVRLCEHGIDTPELLAEYLKQKQTETKEVLMVRRVLGVWNRALTDSEQALFYKWTVTYGFGEAMIAKGYDVTVRGAGRLKLSYMDTVLTKWHEAGITTPAQAEAYGEKQRAAEPKEAAEPPQAGAPAKTGRRRRQDKPRYGTFDPNEAFQKALDRSYGTFCPEEEAGTEHGDPSDDPDEG